MTEAAFVGRAREIDGLDEILSTVCGGSSRCVLVAGEPGIGKTTLCTRFAARARRRGARVCWGRAWEWGGAPPFWPWLQVVRALDTSEKGALLTATPLSQLDQTFAGAAPIAAASTGQRFALFDAVSERLRREALAQPLLIVLEDLHAADIPTLLLLRFVLEQADDAPLLLLGTWRTVEAPPNAEVTALIADISRRVTTIDLAGLSALEVGELISSQGSAKAEASQAALLCDRTGGNPLLVAALIASEGVGGADGAVPLRARAAIERRVARLDDGARAVLAAAAVIGREMAVLLLAQVCDLPLDRVLEAVQTLGAERIFIERPDAPGRYGFCHGLFREVMYAALSPARRLELHRAAGYALEALYGAERQAHSPELARHFLAVSPDPERGFDYSLGAAERAQRSLAYEDAVRHYRQALLASEAPHSPSRRLGEVWLRLGDAQTSSGAVGDAQGSYRRAHQLSLETSDLALEAEAARGFARSVGFGRADDEASRWLALALERDHTPASRVRLLCAQLDRTWMRADAQPRILELSHEALGLARSSGDQRLLAEALAATQVFVLIADAGQFEDYRERSRELGCLARSIGDAELVVEACRWRFTTSMIGGAVDDAKRALQTYERLARELSRPQLQFNALLRRLMLSNMEGRFEETREHLPLLERSARRAGDPQAVFLEHALRVQLQRASGDTQGLEALLVRLDDQFSSDLSEVARAAIRAALEAELGRHEAARRALDEYLRLAQTFLASGGPIALANAAWATWHLRDAARAELLLPLLAPFEGLVLMAGALEFLGPCSLHLGLASAAAGKAECAQAYLRAAIGELTGMGACHLARQAQRVLDSVQAVSTPTPIASVHASPPPPIAAARGVFASDGDTYALGIDGCLARIRGSKGLALIEMLLRQEGVEIHVLELAGSALVERGQPPFLLDARAKAEYRSRIAALEGELSDAENDGDQGRAARARNELDALTSALSQALGFGGRDRPGGVAERARARVTLAIRRAIRSLKATHPAVAAHFSTAISTGTFCVYRPDPRARVLWQFDLPVAS